MRRSKLFARKLFGWFAGLVFISQILLNQSVQASPVWKISNGTETVYLGGTIHVLAESDYPLPVSFQQAYGNAEVVFFETDIEVQSKHEFAQQLIALTSYPDGQGIDTRLSSDTLQKLNGYLQSRGASLQALRRFKPGMLAMVMTNLELQYLGMSGEGVDQFYTDLAIRDGKLRGQLETPEAQIQFIASMGQGSEDDLIDYALQDMFKMREDMLAIKSAWREGDRKGLQEVALIPFREDSPEVFNTLIVERNNNWLPQIEQMFLSSVDELVLVGVLHLVGKEGLLQRLEKKGYSVTQLH